MKQKKRKKSIKKGAYSFIGVFILVVVMVGVMISLKVYDSYQKKKDSQFVFQSRLKEVEETTISEDSSFETIGWIRVEGTNIDYPLVFSSNQDSDFPVELESYAWSLNYDAKFHNKINIMGHNIFNLSSTPKIQSPKFKRFEALMAFLYYDFAKDNRYIQLTIDGNEYIYKIFSVDLIQASDFTSFPPYDDYTESDMISQIDMFTKNSLFQYDVDVNEADPMISLITCTRFFGADEEYDIFVNGRLLRDDEEIKNYKVSTTNNYKKIEKKLKGDGDHEDDSL